MDYLKMAAIAGVLVVGTLAFAVLARNVHVWWMERQERRERKRYYAQVARNAVQQAEEFLKEIQR